MDNRPIGVFDSGLGGLTCVRELISALPGEDIIYLGDTGRVPYGTRSRETIIKYAVQDLDFLTSFDVKRIVVACGTVSSAALGQIDVSRYVGILGVVDSAVRRAVSMTKNGRVGVMGTGATVASGAFERALKAMRGDLEVVSVPCPLLVPLVENGYVQDDNPVTSLVVAEYLAPLLAAGVDTIILACTHYPLIRGCIARQAAGVSLVDTGRQAALALAQKLREDDLLSDRKQGSYRFFVTDAAENFAQLGSMFLNRPITEKVERTELQP